MNFNSPIFLIDAYSQIFRVFFAIAHLSRADGFPTNALFGFGRLMLQIEKEFNPAAGALLFDCGKPAFRLELEPEYKSNRPPMPEDLQKQMPVLRQMAAAFGWPAHQCPNYEADDLIGAAVVNAAEHAFAIISSDKDLAQLVGDRAWMLIPARTGSGFERRDAAATAAKFAVNPVQMVDYLSLIGDASDMIDGVAGVGPKTAAALLAQFHSLDAFFACPEALANVKLRAKLLEARAKLDRNRKLIRLRTDWPAAELGPLENALLKHAPDWPAVAAIFQEYGLKSLLKELPAALSEPVVAEPALTAADADGGDLFQWSEREIHTAADRSGQREPASDDLFAGWDFEKSKK